MAAPLPPFIGFLGGMELAVVFLVFVLLFGIPISVLAYLAYRVSVRHDERAATDDRIESLEAEVDALRDRLEEDEA